LKDGHYRKHGGYAEGYAGNADEGSDPVPEKIGQDQFEEDHADPPTIWVQML
jgi:hypothetical protein